MFSSLIASTGLPVIPGTNISRHTRHRPGISDAVKLHIICLESLTSTRNFSNFAKNVGIMKKLVVLSGSGISAESGISTFRGGGGMWNNYRVEDVASIEGWYRNPGMMIDFYNEMRQSLKEHEPNEAHLLLKELEKDFQVTVITQNVDNLHEKAGSSHIIHLHGEVTKVRPEDCYTDRDNYSLKYVQDIGYGTIALGDKGGPHQKQLRPHIVWFGEAVPNIEAAANEVSTADILLIIGTSLQVYPAAGLSAYAPYGCNTYVIDPADIQARGATHIKAVATAGMREFVKIIKL